MGDPAGQVCAEVGHAGAVLALRAMPYAVAQDRFELVIIIPGDIDLLIDHHSGGPLPDSLAHDPRLVVLDVESLVERDRGDVGREPGDRLANDSPPENTRSSA